MPPMYSEPPSYGEEENSTPTGQGNPSQIRLLTSVDEPTFEPYVPMDQLLPRPLAAHFKKKSIISTPEHIQSLKREEEAISTCKLQGKLMADDIINSLPKIPDGPSYRLSMRKPVPSSQKIQTRIEIQKSLHDNNRLYSSRRSYQPSVSSSHSRIRHAAVIRTDVRGERSA